MGLTTLEARFLRADLIEVFKISRGFENVDLYRAFHEVADGVMREYSSVWELDVGKFKFESLVCEEWNRVDDGIVSAYTVKA